MLILQPITITFLTVPSKVAGAESTSLIILKHIISQNSLDNYFVYKIIFYKNNRNIYHFTSKIQEYFNETNYASLQQRFAPLQ